jgi:hydroxyacylglutathione hydrolase
MTPAEIMEDLFFIQRGYLNGNHFVYRSEQPILIDTGYISDFQTTEKLIKRLAVDVANTKLIVSTHCHCDHIGGNKIVQDRSGCDIAIHKIGKYFIDSRDNWSTWWKYYDQDASFFKCSIGLGDGDTIAVGPHEFEVIYTPGHATDGIVLYNRKERILISSDTLWENDMAVMTVRVEGSRACFSMMESLGKLEKLDVKVVYPGHGKSFTDAAGAIGRARRRLEGFLGNKEKIGNDLLKKIIIYTLLMKKGTEESSFFDQLMTTHWFRENVDFYFEGNYRSKYDEIMNGFYRRGIVKIKCDKLFTSVKP